MKIAILTQPLHLNYGGLLQNYALQQTLIKQGHEVETLTLKQTPSKVSFFMQMKIFATSFAHFILSHYQWDQIDWPFNTKGRNRLAIIEDAYKTFTNKFIKYSPSLDTEKQLVEYCEKQGFDAYIVGSDQIWRPSYTCGMLNWMYLSFVPDRFKVKRISYAASFGTGDWEYSADETKCCSELSKRFDAISVREKSGVSLCKNYLGIKAEHVIDPTMLINTLDYRAIYKDTNNTYSEQDKVFAYILDRDKFKLQIIDWVTTRLSSESDILTSILKLSPYMGLDKAKEISPKPIAQWIRGFAECRFVVTDSFHGTVFSILHHKPFIVIGNSKRGNTRMESLLALFGLENRLLNDHEYPNSDLLSETIDWSNVDTVLEEKRLEAFTFLNNALN